MGRREASKSRCEGGAESWSEEDKYKQDTIIYIIHIYVYICGCHNHPHYFCVLSKITYMGV